MSILSSTRPTLGVAIIAALGAVFMSPSDDHDHLAEAPLESVSPEPDAVEEAPPRMVHESGGAARAQAQGISGRVRHLLAARLERMEVDTPR